MLPYEARVIVAVSGGADSVCLLHVLRELAPASVAGVAHLNHQLRGDASGEDERFVADLAHRLQLPFYAAHEPIAALHDNLEQAGHRARRRFFRSLRAAGHCDVVALGHTLDDQAETVLFRFLRGSGLAGLAGIAPAPAGIIRPLIEVTRADVLQFLKSRDIPWREDASNLDGRFARNRIRRDLLPQLTRDWNPRIADALARLANLARGEEDYWASEIAILAARELVPYANGLELRAGALAALPQAVARRLVRRAIAQTKGNVRKIEYHHVEQVLELARSPKGHACLPGSTVTRSFDWLYFGNPEGAHAEARAIPAPGTYPSPDGEGRICVETAGPGHPEGCATLGMEACTLFPPLQLRGWLPGDHYRPQGHSRDRKIQEMFQKARVPCWRRASWPIIASGDKILWARQFGMAEEEANLVRIREVTLS
ncbi:MAG TPA: tRNA lysidine(34) synthetase TilS [Bryobacteraceae bacterium]|nr:tRNA lysidine(34) synthetase TilS [Bryobacteraceae bacterium]